MQKMKRPKPMTVAGIMMMATMRVQPAALVAILAIRIGKRVLITMEPAIVIMPP